MPWKVEKAPAWPLAPLLAGARARGVADAFEFLGLAAILLDERGEVLHLSAGAIEAMRDELFRDSGRLRARDKLADLRLRIAISSALRDGETGELVLPTRDGDEELTLRIAPIGGGLGEEACQLLRVIVVIDRVAATLETCN
jgi:hypothetical protein